MGLHMHLHSSCHNLSVSSGTNCLPAYLRLHIAGGSRQGCDKDRLFSRG